MKAFRKINVKDRDLDQVQQSVAAVLNPLVDLEILQGVSLKNVVLTTSDLKIAHGLGRTPLGYIVTDLDKNATVFRSSWDTNFITLQSSALTTTVSLWVF